MIKGTRAWWWVRTYLLASFPGDWNDNNALSIVTSGGYNPEGVFDENDIVQLKEGKTEITRSRIVVP